MMARRDCLKDSGHVSAPMFSGLFHFGLMAVSWA
jgi:hypothetical protein